MKSYPTTAVTTSTTTNTKFTPEHQPRKHPPVVGGSSSVLRFGNMNFPLVPRASSTSLIRVSKLAMSSGVNNTLA